MSKSVEVKYPSINIVDIKSHSGSKYLREIQSAVDKETINVDVYAILEAFDVTNPAIAHAVKKLLCTGIRGSKGKCQDISESIDALHRAFQMEESKENKHSVNSVKPNTSKPVDNEPLGYDG